MGEYCPKLLDLIPKRKEWMVNDEGEERRHGSSSDENKLELRLGLPSDEDWSSKHSLKTSTSVREREESLLFLSYFSSSKHNNDGGGGGAIGCGQEQKHHLWSSSCSGYQAQTQQQKTGAATTTTTTSSPFVHNHHQYQTGPHNPKAFPVVAKEPSQLCCTRIVDLQNAEKKAFSPASANTAVPNSSQKRPAPAAVVGWPPLRSFRKNLATTSSAKAASEPQDGIPSKPVNEKPATENTHKGLFVKINMDGVPIGRKVDLNAYNCYENLSSAVDQLFRGLLAAQRDSSGGGIDNKQEEQKPITGLLDGSGEYTLVYEDNEGDRMLVGDVPWQMFVSTVKRLRVLKTSDLPTLSRVGVKQGKVLIESESK